MIEGRVSGWDDPRLLTLDGLRRRGYTPTAINNFCEGIGVARSSNTVCLPKERLEACIRSELDKKSHRALAVRVPLKLTLTNHSPLEANVPNHPAHPEMGSRSVALTFAVFIPSAKFHDAGADGGAKAPKGFKGLALGKPARLLNCATVRCTEVRRDASGAVTELVGEILDAAELGKTKVDAVAWVPSDAVEIEARVYSNLFADCVVETAPGCFNEVSAETAAKAKGVDFTELLNPALLVVERCLVEPSLRALGATPGHAVQFITWGYFCVDKDSTVEKPVWNLTVSLKEAKSKSNNKKRA